MIEKGNPASKDGVPEKIAAAPTICGAKHSNPFALFQAHPAVLRRRYRHRSKLVFAILGEGSLHG